MSFWDGLPFDDWHTVRVGVAGPEHRVSVGRDGEPDLFLRVSAREQAWYYDDDAEPDYVWPGINTPPMLQGPGSVGIIFSIGDHPDERDIQIEIDYFEVTTTLPVEAGGKAATTWGHMKSIAVVR
ncbi:MAG: hypothetical protein ABGY41_20155 [Candidatus Poribacteria bacterium]